MMEKLSGQPGFFSIFGGPTPSFIVMELGGCELTRTNVTEEGLRQAGAAIVRLHEVGLVHLDIKPSNFVWGTGGKVGQVHLIDFGFTSKPGTLVQGFLGSPGWCATSAMVPGAVVDYSMDHQSFMFTKAFLQGEKLPWFSPTISPRTAKGWNCALILKRAWLVAREPRPALFFFSKFEFEV